MQHLLPLLVVLPLGAAFLIPLLSLISARRNWPSGEVVAVLTAAALVCVSVLTFGQYGTQAVWIGGYEGSSDVLGIAGETVEEAWTGRQEEGARVGLVLPGTPADRAGIREGDVLLGVRAGTVDRYEPIGSINELRRINAQIEPGQQLRVRLSRDGAIREVEVEGGKSIAGIPMVSDGLTRLMLVVVSVVAFAAMLFSVSYMRPYTKLHLYYSPIMLMIAGMNGIIISGDLFNIYVFLEVAAVASYALVGFGVESEELEASFKYLVLSAVASGFILIAVAIIYNLRGTLNLAQIADYMQAGDVNDAMWLAIGLFIAGFGLKAAMVPFHAWLPDAHPSAPAPVSAMLSGILIKASGVYVLARLVFNVLGASTAVAWVLMTMGALSMVVGVFLAVGQWDFKRLLAYHSVSQMGYVVLALGVGAHALAARTELVESWLPLAGVAVMAGLFHMMNHAAFKSLLFLTSGSVVFRAGTRNLKELGGLSGKMPFTSWCVRVGALSISGVPPFNGFFSKLLIVIVVAWAGHWFLAALTVLVSFMTLLSFTKVQRYLIEGEVPEHLQAVRESPAPMLLAMGMLAVLCLLLGVCLPLYRAFLLQPATNALLEQMAGYALSVFGG
ncbi:MAG: proton-conducting transporter membrane subunit [Candidatus Brocadiia bacterium]